MPFLRTWQPFLIVTKSYCTDTFPLRIPGNLVISNKQMQNYYPPAVSANVHKWQRNSLVEHSERKTWPTAGGIKEIHRGTDEKLLRSPTVTGTIIKQVKLSGEKRCLKVVKHECILYYHKQILLVIKPCAFCLGSIYSESVCQKNIYSVGLQSALQSQFYDLVLWFKKKQQKGSKSVALKTDGTW